MVLTFIVSLNLSFSIGTMNPFGGTVPIAILFSIESTTVLSRACSPKVQNGTLVPTSGKPLVGSFLYVCLSVATSYIAKRPHLDAMTTTSSFIWTATGGNFATWVATRFWRWSLATLCNNIVALWSVNPFLLLGMVQNFKHHLASMVSIPGMQLSKIFAPSQTLSFSL